MINIILSEEEIARLHAIVIDRDEKEALVFLRDVIYSGLIRSKNAGMKGALDGGKGSTL
ncbi:MAG: hypothetical protein NTZ78_04420 [Candidatus Aureabacteria bacterium]|nr:hypothetical protein [Candidatus Auribacterota bacterium]